MHFKYLEYMYKFSAYTGTSTTEIWYNADQVSSAILIKLSNCCWGSFNG